MKKYAIFLLTFVTFCSQNSNIEVLEEETTTTVVPIVETHLEEPELVAEAWEKFKKSNDF